MDGLVTASQPTLMSAWAQPPLDGHRQQPSSTRQQGQTAMSAAASAAAAARLGQGSVGPAPGGLVPLGKAFASSGPSPGQSLPMLPSPMPDAIVSVNSTVTPSTAPSMLPYQQQQLAEIPMQSASPQVIAARGHQLPVPMSASHSGTHRRQPQPRQKLSSAAQHAQQAQRTQPAAACGVSAAILQEWVTADMQAFVVWVSTHDFMQVSASLNVLWGQ